MSARAFELEAAGAAFVEATVVRCAAPTSARPGDRAIMLGDGSMDGFVGGSCADATVRLQALRALETGEPVLLRILPGEADGPAAEPGAVVMVNPCLSGGALELFLEPHLPAPRVAVAGASPVARALMELAEPLGFCARLDAEAAPGDFAAVVASLGHGDEDALRCGLAAGCEYVGLVASRTHAEIALSILAELVATRHKEGQSLFRFAPQGDPPRKEGQSLFRSAVDPVCGMTVVVGPETPTAGEEPSAARAAATPGSPVPGEPAVCGLVLPAGGSTRLGCPKWGRPRRRERSQTRSKRR